MGKTRSHSGRSNFNYILKQLIKSNIFDLYETKNGILIKSKMNNNQANNDQKNNSEANNKYMIHTDSKKLHELRRWLKNEYGFILHLKN